MARTLLYIQAADQNTRRNRYMTYNFDEIVDRSQNYAAKFEESVLH